MCGIIGITEKNEQLVEAAAKLLGHRGPDAFGIFSDEQVTLGHNRLSIIDLDSRSNQPMADASGSLVVVYNGEIYNYKEVRTRLEKKGYVFRTQSDTEVLLYAYKEWGKGLGNELNGMFAFALYDKEKNELVLATDHANIKPLFYAQVGSSLAFSSELKGIIKMVKEKKERYELDRTALGVYYALGYIPAPETLYKGVKRLPKRGWVVYNLEAKTLTEGQYPARPPVGRSEAEVHKLIEERILSHLVADVPVGVFFSGGTDSSLILSVLHAHNINLETFSVEVAGRPTDEKYFTEIATRLGVKAHRYTFGIKEFEEVYPEVVAKMDEPLYDNSLFPTYFIAKQAAGKVKVVLSGEGGDEYFFGYPRSLALRSLARIPLDTGVGMFERLYIVTPHFRGKNKLFEQLFLWLKKPAAYYLLTMSPGKAFLSIPEWSAAKSALVNSVANTRSFDADAYLPNNLLRKLDMATMYCSLEGRVPLLDPDVIASAQALPVPAEGEEKPVLRHMLEKYLSKELVNRKKQGFGLSLPELLASSQMLQQEVKEALAYLRENKLFTTTEKEIAKYPHLCFALLSLYHTLHNAERI
ncbi:MAG: asparagine synthase (glutamine-hydrolyzing) [Candidatus Pacebacteria bacterium]|nr:asparagine synthase (glutamine-hydrolyzing) [Candidatus Paceibacterota bacterium]